MPEPKRNRAADDATERGSDAPAEAASDVSTDVLSKRDLMNLVADKRPTQVVDGVRLRGLSGREYQTLRGMRVSGARADGEDAEGQFRASEVIAWLVLGVVEPKLARTEWMNLIEVLPAGRVQGWLDAIQEMTGIDDMEVALAKKALAAMGNISQS